MTPESPLITVVVPCYEAGGTVRATVDSLLEQTMTDFELLLVDDCSRRSPVPTDLPADPRLVVVHRHVNGGYARVTNQAVERSRSEWVTFVDADDTVVPTYLERLLEAGEAADAGVVLTPMIRHVEGTVIGTGPWRPPGANSDARTAMRALLRGDLAGTQHVLLRSPEPIAHPDQTYSDFAYLLAHVARGDRVAYVDEPLYLNAVHPASVTGSLRPGIWDLVTLNELIRPVVAEVFDREEAGDLLAAHRSLTLTQILHTTSNERRDTPLRREVMAWCREHITGRGILDQLREGHRITAGSWALAKASGSLHRRAYQLYDSRRKPA